MGRFLPAQVNSSMLGYAVYLAHTSPQGEKQMKQYLVMAQAKDDNINIEFISAHATLEQAKAERDRCIEGDDKHDPCEYFIEEQEAK